MNKPAPDNVLDRVSDVPHRLYEQARARFLANQPLLFESAASTSSAQALGKTELDALAAVGLSTNPWLGSPAEDPLMQSVADYMALLETSYTSAEAAYQLQVDVSRVRQRLREKSLFGVDYDGEKRLPRFQFERKQVLPGLREILAALPPTFNPLDVAQWFLTPTPDLETATQDAVSPRHWLLSGAPVQAVVALARGFE